MKRAQQNQLTLLKEINFPSHRRQREVQLRFRLCSLPSIGRGQRTPVFNYKEVKPPQLGFPQGSTNIKNGIKQTFEK